MIVIFCNLLFLIIKANWKVTSLYIAFRKYLNHRKIILQFCKAYHDMDSKMYHVFLDI